jgi:7,8-dihydroneopterin aldolase/epimerase/oxygenase
LTIEVSGLSLYTHHGVSQQERELGQRLVFDITVEPSNCEAVRSDLVEDTVDYTDVCQQVALVAQAQQYSTLERLCEVVCDRLFERYSLDEVTVRATKPEPPIPLSVESVSVELTRERY